ncbi:MAG: ribonuclease D [Gemmatimonas sp.]|nr:ribonuclease D [Gemmatimonas sp.]
MENRHATREPANPLLAGLSGAFRSCGSPPERPSCSATGGLDRPMSRPAPSRSTVRVILGAPQVNSMRHDYIDSPEALQSAVAELKGESLLGIDTEAAGYHRYYDRISLIQISSRVDNLLIDPIALQDLSPLQALFNDANVEKIFHDADFDLRILDRDAHLGVQGLFDTQIAAAFVGERSLGLGAVVARYLGVNLPKAYQKADWAERPLTDGMREYAATDTAYLPPLRDRLLEELQRLGRVDWAKEEFVRREGTRWREPEDAENAFLRLKGARDVTPRGLAILRELYLWREEAGRARDRATFRVLSNQAMIEMALKAPITKAQLREISGISDGLAVRRGAEMIAAIERGLAIPESELPRFPPARRWERDPEVETRSERLREVRSVVAGNLDLDPGFLISRAILDEIAKRNPVSLDELSMIPDLRNWQLEAIGEPLLRALRA